MGLEQDGSRAELAVRDRKYGAERIGVFLGTSTSGILQTELAYMQARSTNRRAAGRLHIPPHTKAFPWPISYQRYLICAGPRSLSPPPVQLLAKCSAMRRDDRCRRVRCGDRRGADSLSLTTLYGFHSLGLVSEAPCCPFDRNAMVSPLARARLRATREGDWQENSDAVLLLGVGESSDASYVDPRIRKGWARDSPWSAPGVCPACAGFIDYINLHGTASKTNDAAEDGRSAIYLVRTRRSSTKGWTGHTLGAAG
jgi:3-oxoacyl-[acyl-carrier-protein] synthase-1